MVASHSLHARMMCEVLRFAEAAARLRGINPAILDECTQLADRLRGIVEATEPGGSPELGLAHRCWLADEADAYDAAAAATSSLALRERLRAEAILLRAEAIA